MGPYRAVILPAYSPVVFLLGVNSYLFSHNRYGPRAGDQSPRAEYISRLHGPWALVPGAYTKNINKNTRHPNFGPISIFSFFYKVFIKFAIMDWIRIGFALLIALSKSRI